MAGPNSLGPARGHRKDYMVVHLEATSNGTVWTVDTAETDMEFWTATVTAGGAAGDDTFNFKVGYGARRATVTGCNLTSPAAAAPAAADGWHLMVDKPNLSAGTMRVRAFNANATPARAAPVTGTRLMITLSLETL